MWKQLWRKWTIDKPAAFGDWLWEILVVELAAFLDRLTGRQVIAFIPVLILILAYMHRIPLPPELMLVGDLLAYIDVFSMIFLLSMMARAATILYIIRQASERMLSLVSRACHRLRAPDHRHRRVSGTRNRRRWTFGATKHDDDHAPIYRLPPHVRRRRIEHRANSAAYRHRRQRNRPAIVADVMPARSRRHG